jgi:hypothetical protein
VNAEFVRVADSLTVTARELRNAAARRQIARIEPALTRIGTLFTALDAHVPKQYVCPMHCEPGRIYHEPGRARPPPNDIGRAPCRRTREWTVTFRTSEQCRRPNRQVKSITPKRGMPWTG